jgi:hypothetical protein
MSQLPGSPAYLWATGAEGNGLDAMYASINEFLSTNPTAAQIAEAKADYGVSDADIAVARSRLDNRVISSPPPVPAPPPPPPPIPTATSDTVDIVAQIRGEIASGPQNNQGFLNLVLNKYSAADLARAFPEFGNAADYQAAKDGLPKGLIVPGTLDAAGRPQLVRGTPEFIEAARIAKEASRVALRKAAVDNGIGNDTFLISYLGPEDRIFLQTGPNTTVDITNYFGATEKGPVDIPLNVPTYGTSTVETPFRTIEVQALPDSPTTVTTAGGPIQIDANSEVARFIQWQASQIDPLQHSTIGSQWARQGIGNPYSNPAIVANAIERIERANGRTALFNQSGVTPPGSQIAPWNDPNWPAYLGTNKQAYDTASAALADVNVRNNLMAENNWSIADFEIWALRATNPAEAARQDAAAAAASGFVVGPGPSTTALSANGATAVTTTGAVNSQGFAVSSAAAVVTTAVAVSATAANLAGSVTGVVDAVTGAVDAALTSLPVPVLPDIAGIATGFAAGFTDALPTLPSITGALQLTASQVAGLAQAAEDTAAGLLADIKRLPAAIPDSLSPYITAAASAAASAAGLTAINDLLVRQNATIQRAKEQATLEARNNTAAATTDWRVRLSLAPGAQYLYKDPEPGILGPLLATNGVIFPYTPSIETAYTANYDKYDLTHSNYRGYFYKNSAVNDINIRGTFTAQDTFEADYLLAVIHFFRSITKMFYGQDSLRGAPPPLVYLSGFGDYQFNKHPCLVSNFSYSLPTDVDYIRAGAPNNYGNLFSQRAKSGGFSTSPFDAVLSRLQSANLPLTPDISPTPSMITQNVNNLTGATYVPTKIEINLTLLPTNTRAQVSQQFSLKKYADGSLIKGGYW